MIHPHSGTTICRSKRFNSMFRRALLLLGFCRRKYKAGSLSRMSVPLMTAGFSDAALDCRGFKQARFQPEATRSRSTEEGPPHGSPSIEHHCTWLPARRPYTAGIGTAIEVDARARSGTHLKPRPFPLASLHRASLLQISGFSLNIASSLPCLPCGIPEFPSGLLILPYGVALSSSARRGEHCLPVRRCRKHRAADDDNAADDLERSWNGSRESSEHYSPG